MSSTDSLQTLLAQLFAAINTARSGNYSSLVTLTILAYDTVLTLEKEIEHIWSAKSSVPKGLYLFIRYYGLAHTAISVIFTTRVNTPHNLCKAYVWWISVAGPVIFSTAVNVVLLLRIYALYGRRANVLAFLAVLLLVEFTGASYTTIKTCIQATKGIIPTPLGLPIPGCLTTSSSHLDQLTAWIPCLVISAIFFSMTVYKLWDPTATGRRDGRRFILKLRNFKYSPLILAFVKDGAVYYLAITMMLLASTLISIVLPNLEIICIPWLIGVYSIAGSRLILNLREAAIREQGHTATWRDAISVSLAARRTISAMRGNDDEAVSERTTANSYPLHSYGQ